MSVASQGYRDALQQRAATLSDAQRTLRAANLEAFLRQGFPTPAQEDWHYTDLAPVAAQTFASAEPAAPPDLSDHWLAGCERIVFVNGHFDAGLSDLRSGAVRRHCELPQPLEPFEEEAVCHLNAALATDGAVIRVPAGAVLAEPIHVVTLSLPGVTPSMAHLAHSIVVEAGAQASVFFHQFGLGAGPQFVTQTLNTRVLPNARLDLVRLQQEGDDAYALTRWDVLLERDAQAHLVNIDLGGRLVRNDLNVWQAEPGVSIELAGLFAPRGQAHVDNHTRIEHAFPHGRSRELYRGIVMDKAHAVFNGKVVVRPGAQKTDSEQHVATLLLSPGAEVNAKPELEIYADDVKCAHGATCGQLDETAIYYLRSRGLPQEAARNVLLYTFAHEVTARIAFEPARRLVERRILAVLPGGAALESLT